MMVRKSNPSDSFYCQIIFGYCLTWANLNLLMVLLTRVEKQKLQEVTGLTLSVTYANHVQ